MPSRPNRSAGNGPLPVNPAAGNASAVPIGERAARVLALAYRARRAALLEGPTGIGKSELVRQVAATLTIDCRVLDLSLLEPPDLVGLPVVRDGLTTYATPAALPTGGAGILLLEELNRADRTIQQPALQLLTARRLHEYQLPPDWVPFAAINPEDGEYQVTPLDPALRSRFLVLPVRADVQEWRRWADTADIHPVIRRLATSHPDLFDTTSPRSWTYASDVLQALSPTDRTNRVLLTDALGGYLPAVWVKRVIDQLERAIEADDPLLAEVRALLGQYHTQPQLRARLAALRDGGQTDRFHLLARRLLDCVDSPELLRLMDNRAFSLEAFDALLADLPGDHRAALQRAIAGQAAAARYLPLRPEDVVHPQYVNSSRMAVVAEWLSRPHTKHRAWILAHAIAAWLDALPPTELGILKQKKSALAGLAAFLRQVGPTGHPLTATVNRLDLPVGP